MDDNGKRKGEQMKKCIWGKEEACWSTDCGRKFVVNDGSPLENGMVYCPFCARVIYIKRGETEKTGDQA